MVSVVVDDENTADLPFHFEAALGAAEFREPGGDKLKAWIDTCPNPLYSALVFQGGAFSTTCPLRD